MNWFPVLLCIALIVSAIGFYKYVYFISLGYGFSIAAIGIVSFFICRDSIDVLGIILCLLLFLYGNRLSGYLLIRELKSNSYNNKMKGEISDGKNMKLPVKFAIWITCALLYACQTAPIYFRLIEGSGATASLVIGILIMVFGVTFETIADIQKNNAKKIAPDTFVSTGLFKIVRCPNYLGEMIFWTGVLISGIGSFSSVLGWTASILGYLGIIYVMFSGARRLEIRQDKHYGEDPKYQEYGKTTPIMVPFIHLYSVKKHKWLVG